MPENVDVLLDLTHDNRVRDAIKAAYASVESRGRVQRAKRSVVSFKNTRKPGVKGGATLVVKMGAGIGAGILVGMAITPPGLVAVAVVATTLAGAGAGKLIDKVYQSHKSSSRKSSVLETLGYFSLNGITEEQKSNSKLAEQFLQVFIRDTQVKFPGELAKVARKAPTDHQVSFAKGTREADLASPRGRILGKYDFTIPGASHENPGAKIHPVFGTSMPPDEAVRHRWRRIDLYNSWIQAYTKNLSEELNKMLKSAKDNEETIKAWTSMMIGLNDHRACPDNCCFGPREQDLRKVAPDVQMVSLISMNKDLKELATTDSSIRSVAQVHDDEDKGECEDAAEAVAFTKDLALNAAGAGMSNVGIETGNAVFKTAGAAVGGTALPVIGELVGLAMNEAMKSYTTNYPLQERVGCLRKLTPQNGRADFDEEIKQAARSGSTDMLARSLRKVHSQYAKRIVDRKKKLDEFLGKIKGREDGVLYSCEEAVTLLRYYFKLVRYYEKALIHTQLVSKRAELITEDVKKRAKRGY